MISLVTFSGSWSTRRDDPVSGRWVGVSPVLLGLTSKMGTYILTVSEWKHPLKAFPECRSRHILFMVACYILTYLLRAGQDVLRPYSVRRWFCICRMNTWLPVVIKTETWIKPVFRWFLERSTSFMMNNWPNFFPFTFFIKGRRMAYRYMRIKKTIIFIRPN